MGDEKQLINLILDKLDKIEEKLDSIRGKNQEEHNEIFKELTVMKVNNAEGKVKLGFLLTFASFVIGSIISVVTKKLGF